MKFLRSWFKYVSLSKSPLRIWGKCADPFRCDEFPGVLATDPTSQSPKPHKMDKVERIKFFLSKSYAHQVPMGKGDKWMVFLRRGFSCAESMRKPIPNPKTNRKKQTILTRFESSWSFKQTKLLCGICRIRSSLPCECACDRWVDDGYGMP